MATVKLSQFLRCLTRGMAAEALADWSDRELVARFLACQDEAVFEAFVRRHGPMVYRVCWRVLQHSEDAEDAFQATFLILAQKLRSLRKHGSLASWLHGVAHRIAMKAKTQAASRRRRERQASSSRPVPPDEIAWHELRTVLDAALAQLPDKWRLPLILCYLEGRTQDEAAGQLGCSKSTFVRRLEEARVALRRRLTREGVVWPAPLSAVLFSDCTASASLPPRLIHRTVQSATLVAMGKTAAARLIPAKVAALTQGVLKAMLVDKIKTSIALLLTVAGLLSFTVAGARHSETGQKANQEATSKKETPKQERASLTPPQLSAGEPASGGDKLAWREMVTMKHEHAITALACSSDWSVAGDERGHLFAWDTKTGQHRLPVEGGGKTVDRLQFTADEKDRYTPEGKSLYVIWGGGTGIARYFVKDKKFEGGHGFGGDGIAMGYLGLSADAEICLEFFREGKAVNLRRNAYEFKMGKFEVRPNFDPNHHEFVEYRAKVSHALVSAGDKWLAVATKDGTLHIHDRASLKETHTIAAGKEGVVITDVQFSADGQRIAVARDDTLAKIYDTEKGEEVATLKGHSGIVFAVAFGPDGKKVVTGGDDNTARVWDTATGKALATLKGHTDSVRCVAFDPSGEILITGSADKTVKLWTAK